MPSTFGSFVVYKDEKGVQFSQNPPKYLRENETERTQYSGPTAIMQETVLDLNKWLAKKRKEGFTFKKAK